MLLKLLPVFKYHYHFIINITYIIFIILYASLS